MGLSVPTVYGLNLQLGGESLVPERVGVKREGVLHVWAVQSLERGVL